jgi:GNAT superfamily N-acetyltransferase
VTFHPGCEAAFEALNREWLEEFFAVEPKDEQVFRDPHGEIVRGGGEIFFVRDRDQFVGTCAIVCHGNGTYELSKMAVTRHARGHGYGDWLVRTALALVRSRGAKRFYLLSDERLPDALRLYERAGFRRAAFPGDTGYARGNVMMEYPL